MQTAAFLVLMACKGETVQEIKAMVEVMRSHAIKVEVPYPVVDVVGTGGDGYHTVSDDLYLACRSVTFRDARRFYSPCTCRYICAKNDLCSRRMKILIWEVSE